MSHTSQRRGLDPSRPNEEIIVLASLPKAFRKSEPARKAMSELAAKMLEHGRNHWPKWTNDRLAAVDPATPSGVATWDEYQRRWTRGNHLRVAVCVASVVVLAASLALQAFGARGRAGGRLLRDHHGLLLRRARGP